VSAEKVAADLLSIVEKNNLALALLDDKKHLSLQHINVFSNFI